MGCQVFDRDANLQKAANCIEEAARTGAELCLLPEFLPSGCTYHRSIHEFAEPIGGPTTEWMQQASRRFGCWIAGGIIERDGSRTYDTFLMTAPSGQTWSYRKRYPGFFENVRFHRGRSQGIFETELGRIGVMICWDMVHSRLLREMRDQVDLLLICSAWPDVTTGSIPLWGVQNWLSRQPFERPIRLASALKVPVAYCNMAGPFETPLPGLGLTYRCEFAGNSSITDHTGRQIRALSKQEAVLLAEVDIGEKRQSRQAA